VFTITTGIPFDRMRNGKIIAPCLCDLFVFIIAVPADEAAEGFAIWAAFMNFLSNDRRNQKGRLIDGTSKSF
jgi:hypothetical protein